MFERDYQHDLSQFSFLITGGAGFIGSHIVEYLINNHAGKVRVLDNFSTGSMENIKVFIPYPSFELIEGDIRNLDECRKAVKGIDFVSHHAALGSVPRSIIDPISYNDVNIGGFLNMLIAAKEQKIIKMVYASSSSVYGDNQELQKIEDVIGTPLSPYGITKKVNENYAELFSNIYDFHSIGFRYFNIFGPRQNSQSIYSGVIPTFIDRANRGCSPEINGDGEITRDFTYVQNAVQANLKAWFASDITKHEIINIGCGKQISLNFLWKIIREIFEIDIQPRYVQERKGDIKSSLANICKAERLLNYYPEIHFLDGLKRTIYFYKNTSGA